MLSLVIAATFAIFLLIFIFQRNLYQAFWDDFIYKYYIGPIKADAGTDRQIEAGYNIINTLSYGIFLALGLVGVYKLLKSLDVKIDARFVTATTFFIMAGSILRVLEDADLFKRPFVYIFISPYSKFLD